MADRITISGIRGIGFHGVFDHERTDGQEFIVDVEYQVAAGTGADDDLAHTVDYGVVSQRVYDLITGEPRALIERLAQDIAEACLAMHGVQSVVVTVHKPHAPIAVPFADVTVRIERP